MGYLSDFQREARDRVARGESVDGEYSTAPPSVATPALASTQQPQIMPLANTGESPRTPDSVFAPPPASTQQPQIIGAPLGVTSPRTPDSVFAVPSVAAAPTTLPALADAGAVRSAAYPVTPSVASAASAPIASPPNAESPALTVAGNIGTGVREGLGAGVAGGVAAGKTMGAVSDAVRTWANRTFMDPVFRLAEALAGMQPGGFAPANAAPGASAPASPVKTATSGPVPTSPVGERYVPLTPPQGAQPPSVAAAPAAPAPGTVTVRVGPDGRKTYSGTGAPEPAPVAAPAGAPGPVAAAQPTFNVPALLQAFLADEDARSQSQPRYVGGVGRGYAMSAADAASANATTEKISADRRGKILDFIHGVGNTEQARERTGAEAPKINAEVGEIGARTEREQQQTKTAQTQEAERKQALELERQLAAETDPKKINEIQRKLAAFKGKVNPQPKSQIFMHESVDPATFTPTKTPYIADFDEGGKVIGVRPAIPGAAGPAGMVYIGKTPDGKKRVFQDSKGNKHVED